MNLLFQIVYWGILLTIAWIVYRKLQKRNVDFRARLGDLGLTTRPGLAPYLCNGLAGLPGFNRFRDNDIRNVFWGDMGGCRVALFELRWQSDSVLREPNYYAWETGIYFEDRHLDLPAFQLGPEGLWHKIGAFFGGNEVNPMMHPEFSRRYSLRGSNEAELLELFDDQLVAFFEQQIVPPERIGLPGLYYQKETPLPSVFAEGNRFALLSSRRIKPSAVPLFAQAGIRLCRELQRVTGVRRAAPALSD